MTFWVTASKLQHALRVSHQPGGICISSSAYDQVSGRVDVEFVDLGEQNLKNIARPIRAYAVVPKGLGPMTQAGLTQSPLFAPHLSVVVLPFANIGGDPEQDYFVDGVTESLTTDLSRISGSFVIARNSASGECAVDRRRNRQSFVGRALR
jgi:hypothetical protein